MNSPSVAPMLIFIATVFLIFKQPTVRIPFASKYLRIDYGLAPVVGVIVLLATLSIGIDTIARGIIGGANVKPYSILVLIMSLSYICISLDFTGFFEYLSLHVIRASKDSGKRLFVYFFLLASFLTLFTNNDIVILTMTHIILYVGKNAGIDPIPFLFAQFFAVNIFGMALYIGNPTNIVAADAYGLSFVEFARWMFLPSISAGVSCLFLLWLVFGRRVPSELKTPEIDPRLAIKDKAGALFGSIVLACTILFMSLPTGWTGVSPWVLALFFAIVKLLHDAISYRSSISAILSRMPWKIVPFLMGLFIMVESLASAGWIDLFASQISKISGSLTTTVFGICFLSTLTASVMNNHPMTIFFVRAFQSPSFTAPAANLGPTLALIAGSNFGANFALTGALAGLMWAKILSDKGCPISFSEFSKYGFLIMPPVVVVTCSALVAEFMMWT